MNPTAFSLFGLEVRWYGILIATGIILALLIAYLNCNKKGLSFDTMLDIFIWSFPMAIIGARLYYVIFEWSYYKDNLGEILRIRQGGLAIHGGLIFAIATAYIYTKIKKVDFIDFADIAAPSIIIAQSLGRWGNFFNQEAHGSPVSEEFINRFPEFIKRGMYISGEYYHPTFLYESVWNLCVFAILICILYKLSDKYKGITICSYGVLYSVGRFFIEALRTDSLYIGQLRVAQLVSLMGIVVGCALIIIIIKKKAT